MAGTGKAKARSDRLEVEEELREEVELRLTPKIEPATKKQIEARAYELYLQRGCENGHDVEDWLTAEKEVKRNDKWLF